MQTVKCKTAPLLSIFLVTLIFFVSPCRAVEQSCEVIAASANIRSGPGTGYRVVTTATKGTKLKIVEETDKWLRIVLPREGPGWIFRDMVAVTGWTGSMEEAVFGTMKTDYGAVDKMNDFSVSPGKLIDFIRDGGLIPEKTPWK